jgi:hypothetical protein
MEKWTLQTLLNPLKTFYPMYTSRNLGLGFSVLSVLCAICGSIPPLRIRKYSIFYYALHLYSYLTTFTFTLIMIAGTYMLQNHISNSNDFQVFVYFICGYIGQIECCLRMYFIHFKRNKIENLVLNLQKFVSEPHIRKYQMNITKRLTRFIIIMATIFLISYIFGITSNYLAFKSSIDQFEWGKNISLNPTFEEREYHSYIQSMQKLTPDFATHKFKYYTYSYIICAIALGALIFTDILFYCFYHLIIDEVEILTKVLAKFMIDKEKMNWWLRSHQLLTR